MKNKLFQSDFYCTQCGEEALPVWRHKNSAREAGHLKKLFCLRCNKETNCVECNFGSGYTKEDFQFEFRHKNFTSEGQRIYTIRQLRSLFENEEN